MEVGAAQGGAGGRHRRRRPSRLAGRGSGEARSGRGGAVPAETGARVRGGGRGARFLSGDRPIRDRRRDQQHLQEARPHPQGAQHRLLPLLRDHREPPGGAGEDRQHPFGRTADPRPGQPGSAGDRACDRRPLPPDSRPHLDAVVLDPGLQVRLRLGGGVLRRPDPAHLRGRDRPLLRPAHELARLLAGPLHADLQLRRPLAAQAGAGGNGVRHRPELRRAVRRARERRPRPLPRHDRVLPGGRQVPPGRSSQVRGLLGAGDHDCPRRPLLGLRQARDGRRLPPDGGAGRPPARRAPGCRRTLCEPHPAAGGALRDAGSRSQLQTRADGVPPPAEAAGAGAEDPAGPSAGGDRRGRRCAAGGGHPPHAGRRGAGAERVRRRVRGHQPVRRRGGPGVGVPARDVRRRDAGATSGIPRRTPSRPSRHRHRRHPPTMPCSTRRRRRLRVRPSAIPSRGAHRHPTCRPAGSTGSTPLSGQR